MDFSGNNFTKIDFILVLFLRIEQRTRRRKEEPILGSDFF